MGGDQVVKAIIDYFEIEGKALAELTGQQPSAITYFLRGAREVPEKHKGRFVQVLVELVGEANRMLSSDALTPESIQADLLQHLTTKDDTTALLKQELAKAIRQELVEWLESAIYLSCVALKFYVRDGNDRVMKLMKDIIKNTKRLEYYYWITPATELLDKIQFIEKFTSRRQAQRSVYCHCAKPPTTSVRPRVACEPS